MLFLFGISHIKKNYPLNGQNKENNYEYQQHISI